MLAIAIICVIFITRVSGHAYLTEPFAWNPQPSKTSPCGGGGAFLTLDAAEPTIATTWSPDVPLYFGWQLISQEGQGAVTVSVASNYGTNFNVVGIAEFVSGPPGANNQIAALGDYVLSITPPSNLLCSGGVTGNLCSVQFSTASGWYSCTTVTSANAVEYPHINNTISPETCVAGHGDQNMFFCAGSFAIDQPVYVGDSPNIQTPYGFTQTDESLNATFYQNMNSVLVFTNSKTSTGAWNTNCATAYRRYLCAQYFPLCSSNQKSGISACKSICYAAADTCGLTSSHQNLFNCETNANFPSTNTATTFDSVGQCPACTGDCVLSSSAERTTSSLISAASFVVMSMLLAFVVMSALSPLVV